MSSEIRTQIAQGTKVVGEISSAADVAVDGIFEGTLKADNAVVVGGQGEVRGEINASQITVHGRVRGNLAGKKSVDLQSSGRVEGDIVAPRVMILDGAFFKGNLDMVDEVASDKPATQGSGAPSGGMQGAGVKSGSKAG